MYNYPQDILYWVQCIPQQQTLYSVFDNYEVVQQLKDNPSKTSLSSCRYSQQSQVSGTLFVPAGLLALPDTDEKGFISLLSMHSRKWFLILLWSYHLHDKSQYIPLALVSLTTAGWYEPYHPPLGYGGVIWPYHPSESHGHLAIIPANQSHRFILHTHTSHVAKWYCEYGVA